MIKKEDIIDYSITMSNNTTPYQMIGSNQSYNIHGHIEIKFSVNLKNENKDFSDLITIMNNRKEIDIETSKGILIGCLITAYYLSVGDADKITELVIEGIAKRFDEIIEVIFKDCVKKVNAFTYNTVIGIIGTDITYDEYSRQAMVEEL